MTFGVLVTWSERGDNSTSLANQTLSDGDDSFHHQLGFPASLRMLVTINRCDYNFPLRYL